MAQKRVDVLNRSGSPLRIEQRHKEEAKEAAERLAAASAASALTNRQENMSKTKSNLNQSIQRAASIQRQIEDAQESKVSNALESILKSKEKAYQKNDTQGNRESLIRAQKAIESSSSGKQTLLEQQKKANEDAVKAKQAHERAVEAYKKYFPNQQRAAAAVSQKPVPIYTEDDLKQQKALLEIEKMTVQDQQDLMTYALERDNNFSFFNNMNTPDVVWVPGSGIHSVSTQMQSAEALSRLLKNGYTKVQIDSLSDAYSRNANAETAQILKQSAAQLAEQNPILANIVRVPLNLAGGTIGAVDYGLETLKGLLDKSKRDQQMDSNRPSAALSQIADVIYSTTRENIETGKGGKLGGIAYGAATSLLDNMARFYAGGASKAGTLALAGASAFSDSVRDASEIGGTASQAALKGMADAASEIFTELLPLDEIIALRSTDLGSVENLLKSALKQAGAEVAGEEINYGVGLLSDLLIMGDKSRANLQKRQLMAEGLSEKEAEKQVVRDILTQAGTLAAETALSAGAQAGVEGSANLYRSKNNQTPAQVTEHVTSVTDNTEQTPAQKGAQALGDLINDTKRIFGKEQSSVDTKTQADYDKENTQGGYPYGEERLDNSGNRRISSLYSAESAGESLSGRSELYREVRGNGDSQGTSGGSVQSRDSEGREVNASVIESLRESSVVDENKRPIPMYHVTDNMDFTTFGKGDVGFHFGPVGQTLKHADNRNYDNGRTFRVYLNIKNPVSAKADIMNWHANASAMRLFSEGIIDQNEYQQVLSLWSNEKSGYDDPASVKLREILESKGYDGIKYPNSYEGDGDSYIAFRDDQIIRSEITPFSNANPSVGTTDAGFDVNFVQTSHVNKQNGSEAAPESVNTKNEAVGAADRNFSGLADYYDLISDDNVQPSRASDVGFEEVPVKDAFGNKVSENAANVINSGMLSARDVDNVKRLISQGAYGHQTQKMEDVRRQAISELEGHPLADEVHKISKKVAGAKFNEHDIAKAQILLAHYTQQNGQAAENLASQLLLDLEQMATQSGRQLNMFKLLRQMTPEGQTLTVKKRVDKYVEDLNQNRSDKKQAEVEIPQELLNEHTKAAADAIKNKDSAEARKKLEDIENQIYGIAASQIKSTFKEKWDAWRHMAMLGNVKTQLRNAGGSLLFRPFVSVKRAIGAALETAFEIPQKQRTKAIIGLDKNARALLSLAAADAKANTDQYLKGSAKTGDFDRSKIDDKRAIFDYSASQDTSESPQAIKKAWESVNKGLEASRKGLTDLMEGTDMVFKRWEYRSSLASFIKARGYTAQQWKDGKIPAAVMAEGRAYAAKEAMKATFNDQNLVSNKLSKLRAKGNDSLTKILNFVGEGVFPYRRTPANVAVRAVEYSPVNVARSIVTSLSKVRTGKMSAAECLDQLASGLTGTGAMVLGSALAGGIFGVRLVGAQDDEDKERAGHQKYSLEFGDKYSVTIDWAAPSVIPLFVGANIYNDITNGTDDVSAFAKVVTALGNTFEPMLELSCLSSFNDLAESIRYSQEGDAVYTVAAQVATSYLMQALPTLGSQFDQLGDDTRQMVYATSEDPTERALQKFVGKAFQKLPGDLYQTEYVDAWGRTDKTNWLESLISPSYAQKIDNSTVEKEVQRLNSVQDTNVSPNTPQYTITIDGKKRRLSPEQWTSLAKQQGQTAYNIIEKLIETEAYKQLTDTEKAKAIEDVYSYARENARVSVLKDYKEYSEEWMDGISGKEAETIAARAIVSASGLSDARYERAIEQDVNLSQMKKVSSSVSEALESTESKTEYDTYRAVLDTVSQEDSGKWLQIYGMSETRLEEMEQAKKNGISGEVFVDFLEAESKLGKAFTQITTAWKEGEDASLDGLSDAYEAYDSLPVKAKQYFQDGLGGRLEAFANAMDAGVSERTFIDLWKQYYELDNSSNTESQNANQWASILDKAKMGGRITQTQRDTLFNDLGFYIQLRQDAQKYHDLTSEGLKPDVALTVANMMTGIAKTAEKLNAIASADLTESEKKASVYAYFDEDQDAKFKTITDMGFDTETYAVLYGLYSEASGDGKKKRVISQYQQKYGLTSSQANKIYDIYAGKK